MRAAPASDVILAGNGGESDRGILREGGISASTSRSPLDALVFFRTSPARVVVLSARELAARTGDAVRAFKDLKPAPQVLLKVPPHLVPSLTSGGFGADDSLFEPYAPEDLLDRVRALLVRQRDRERLSPAVLAGTGLADESLAGLFHDLSDLNRSAADLDELVEAIVAVFHRRTTARRVSLCIYDPRDDQLLVSGGMGLPIDIEPGYRIPMGRGVAGRVAETRRPMLARDLRSGAARELANRGTYETSSFLCLPLVAGDSLVGIVSMADKENDAAFDEGDLALLSVLSGEVAQITQTTLKLEHMTTLSVVDDLTGLYNRRFFRRSLEWEFRRARRYDRPLTLAILDLDHFKLYNDMNGHEAGNRALKKIGEILRTSFRSTDVVARYGGEEFAVILPELEKGVAFVPDAEDEALGAYLFLERVRGRIQEATFENEERLPGGCLTISGGVASHPTDAGNPDELLEVADRSLYLAKAEGRNRVHLA